MAVAEVALRVVRQPAVELAAARAAESASQPQAAESAQRAALLVESEALVAHLKLNSTPTPQSCRDRNSVSTAQAARAK